MHALHLFSLHGKYGHQMLDKHVQCVICHLLLVSVLVRLTVVSLCFGCFGIMLIILSQFEEGSDLFKWSTVNETLEELKKKCGLLWPFIIR